MRQLVSEASLRRDFRVNLKLEEKGFLLDVPQQVKDQPCAHVKDLQKCLPAERKLVSHSRACHKAKKEQLAQAQNECKLLQQQVEEAQNNIFAKEHVTEVEKLLSSECKNREKLKLMEERSKELATKAADFQPQISEERYD